MTLLKWIVIVKYDIIVRSIYWMNMMKQILIMIMMVILNMSVAVRVSATLKGLVRQEMIE